MIEQSLAHPAHPPERVHREKDEENRRAVRRERRQREGEIEAARIRFEDASLAYFLLLDAGNPKRLERAAKVMYEAASVLR